MPFSVTEDPIHLSLEAESRFLQPRTELLWLPSTPQKPKQSWSDLLSGRLHTGTVARLGMNHLPHSNPDVLHIVEIKGE